jgi:cytochrome o ubiquinol oxidase operon protein cyoD
MKTDSHPSTHGRADAASHGSMSSYMLGFFLSLALTVASFWVIMAAAVPPSVMLVAIVALCVIQLLVQLAYFLHIGTAPDQRENTAIFVCTGLLIVIIVAGSLWVMHNANVNMMPTRITTERAMSHD